MLSTFLSLSCVSFLGLFCPFLQSGSLELNRSFPHFTSMCTNNSTRARLGWIFSYLYCTFPLPPPPPRTSTRRLSYVIFSFSCQDDNDYLSMNGSSSSHPQPTVNGDLPSESTQLIDFESKNTGDSSSHTINMNGNKTDDEKTSSLQMPAKNDAYTTNREREASWYNPGERTTKTSLVEETVLLTTAPTAQSSSASRMDGLFLKLDEDEGLLGNQARYDDRVRPSVCLSISLSVLC